ncbi:hypothetical protein B0H13DRAFT_2548126 [Mycena leptocephala]|nr:hypothetical protein B0H13DRAFT_2548126 [Mycena leptocephala]
MAEQTNPFAAFANLTLSYLEDSLGVLYIGYVFAAVGYGFTFFQSYLYYTRYPKDRWLVQATVLSLCTLDTAMSILSSHTLYYYLVTLFALPIGPEEATTLKSFYRPSLSALYKGSPLETLHVSPSLRFTPNSSFYAIRIWQVSQNPVLAVSTILVSIAGAALGIATTVVMLRNPLFANFSEDHIKAVISTGQGLRGKPSMWDPITYLLASGVAGTVAQLICFVTFLALPKKYLWIIFHFLSSRVFINGLLLMLNSRTVSRGRGFYEEETRLTDRGVTPTLHTQTGASDLLFFNGNIRSNKKCSVNIEVSRVVNSDARSGKHPFDDTDSHSNHLKVDVHAF